MHHVFRIFILGPFERRYRGGKRRVNPPCVGLGTHLRNLDTKAEA